MTGMLASVTTANEAELVLETGADIIDLKDPAAGALGALPAATIREIVAAVAARRPVSATVGDLPMQAEIVSAAVAATAGLGVDIVKVGLFADGDREGCLKALGAHAARGIRLVAVMFADQRPDLALVERARDLGLYGVMLDTADKRGGGLRRHLDNLQLAEFVRRARAARLICGLAGSLQLADIPALLPLKPDYLGFRGALCSAGRTSALDPMLARAVYAAMSGTDQPASPAANTATAAAGAQRAAHSRISARPPTRLAKST